MVTKRELKSRNKKPKKVKAPHNPNVGYITHDKNGNVATGRTEEVIDYLTGESIEAIDKERYALRPGRRISRYGNVYYELRKNRADRNPVEGL